ncbi:MAG: hypothetical protein Q8N85_02975 [Candidatus Omnitrophota bacterium]|nr:hypothetical protein [Candidatus Omnitrophota bacterium]
MEQKAKFIILGLAGIAIVGFFLFAQTLNEKNRVTAERDGLKEKNSSLKSDVSRFESRLRESESRLSALNAELDKISRERDELGKKYELVNKAKEELAEKLKQGQAQPVVSAVTQLRTEAAPPQNVDAYWAEVFKAKTSLEIQLSSIRNDLKSTQISNEQLQREKNSLELDMGALKREKEDLKRQLDYNQKVMDSISQDLVRERNDKIKIRDTFQGLKGENTALIRQLKSLIGRKASLEKKLQALQEEGATIENRYTQMQAMLSEKVAQVNTLKEQLENISTSPKLELPQGKEEKQSVELPPIVVHPKPEPAAQESAPLKGKILAINKDSNFVIIDLGEDKGVKSGNLLQVYRDQKAVADIEVIQTRKDIAACDIKKEKEPIKIGDAVR